MRRLYFIIAIAVATCMMLAPGPSMAQMGDPLDERLSDTEGLFLSAHVAGNGFGVFDDSHAGPGLGLKLGYGFSPLFTLFARSDGAVMRPGSGSPFGLGHIDLGARFHLGAGEMLLVPYVDLAVSGHGIAERIDEDTATMRGLGVTGGVGVQYFVTPDLGIDMGATLTVGEFTQAEVNGASQNIEDGRTRSARVILGLSWYPF